MIEHTTIQFGESKLEVTYDHQKGQMGDEVNAEISADIHIIAITYNDQDVTELINDLPNEVIESVMSKVEEQL